MGAANSSHATSMSHTRIAQLAASVGAEMGARLVTAGLGARRLRRGRRRDTRIGAQEHARVGGHPMRRVTQRLLTRMLGGKIATGMTTGMATARHGARDWPRDKFSGAAGLACADGLPRGGAIGV